MTRKWTTPEKEVEIKEINKSLVTPAEWQRNFQQMFCHNLTNDKRLQDVSSELKIEIAMAVGAWAAQLKVSKPDLYELHTLATDAVVATPVRGGMGLWPLLPRVGRNERSLDRCIKNLELPASTKVAVGEVIRESFASSKFPGAMQEFNEQQSASRG